MEFEIIVITTTLVLQPETGLYKRFTRSDNFCCMNDALDFLKKLDFPPTKISIHVLTH